MCLRRVINGKHFIHGARFRTLAAAEIGSPQRVIPMIGNPIVIAAPVDLYPEALGGTIRFAPDNQVGNVHDVVEIEVAEQKYGPLELDGADVDSPAVHAREG